MTASQRLSPAQQECILRHYDRTLGGVEVVSAEHRSTLLALYNRGIVTEIQRAYDGGPYCAKLTEEGLLWRSVYEGGDWQRSASSGEQTP